MMKQGDIEEMLRDFSSGVYDLTENGECTKCGSCCSNFLPMTKTEIEVIRKYIAENGIKEQRILVPTSNVSFDMNCPFLNTRKDKDKCEIYPVRPKICRDFICCPHKRPKMSLKYALTAKVIDVRKEFFNESYKSGRNT